MESSYKKTLKWMSKTDRRRLYTLHTMCAYKNRCNGYEIYPIHEISERSSLNHLRAVLIDYMAKSNMAKVSHIRKGYRSTLEFLSDNRWFFSFSSMYGLNSPARARSGICRVPDNETENIYVMSESNQDRLDRNLRELSAITNPTKRNLRGYVNEKKRKS